MAMDRHKAVGFLLLIVKASSVSYIICIVLVAASTAHLACMHFIVDTYF